MVSTLRQSPVTGSAPLASTWSTQASNSAPAPLLPPVRWLRLPGADQALRYRLSRWTALLAAHVRPHRLLPAAAGHHACRCEPSDVLRERFAELFDLRTVGDDLPGYPILYTQGVIDLLQARLLADLGVNGRHVRLLRHRTRLLADEVASLSTGSQDIDCRLVRVVRVGPTEVVALIETCIADASGRALVQLEDVFAVSDLQVAYAVQATEDDLLRRAVSRMRRHGREIDAAGAGVRQRQLFVAPDAGRRFARLAGGPAAWPRPARAGTPWWRARRPAVAPMYLRHLVTRELAEWGLDQSSLQMVFIGRGAAGQMLRLLLQGRSFELIDERGRLVAFGKA
jgi:hypothetical protein